MIISPDSWYKLTQSGLGTASLEDTAGGSPLDGREGGLVADAGEISGRAGALAGNGIVDAGKSALGDVREGLGTHNGGEGNGNDSVLHFDGVEYRV